MRKGEGRRRSGGGGEKESCLAERPCCPQMCAVDRREETSQTGREGCLEGGAEERRGQEGWGVEEKYPKIISGFKSSLFMHMFIYKVDHGRMQLF